MFTTKLFILKFNKTSNTNLSIIKETKPEIVITKREFFSGGWNSVPITDKKHHAHFEKRLLHATPEQVFTVVADVQKYKEFVPYVKESQVVEKNSKQMKAELVIGFQMFQEKYSSNVFLDFPKQIKVEVSDERASLFHFLNNTWKFEPGPTPNSCWTSFSVSFQFKSEFHRAATDLFFSEVQKRMLSAFERRCSEIYGNPLNPKTKIV